VFHASSVPGDIETIDFVIILDRGRIHDLDAARLVLLEAVDELDNEVVELIKQDGAKGKS